jgi:hypothetical protein
MSHATRLLTLFTGDPEFAAASVKQHVEVLEIGIGSDADLSVISCQSFPLDYLLLQVHSFVTQLQERETRLFGALVKQFQASQKMWKRFLIIFLEREILWSNLYKSFLCKILKIVY